jgi:hypothetical protein
VQYVKISHSSIHVSSNHSALPFLCERADTHAGAAGEGSFPDIVTNKGIPSKKLMFEIYLIHTQASG